MSRKDSERDYDAIIVGAGPAGASASVHLALQGARVLLIEREKFPRAKLCGEFISPECLAHFARLGVLEAMHDAGGACVGETIFYARSGRSVSVPSAWFANETNGAAAAAAAMTPAGALGLSRAEMDERLLGRARAVGVEVLEETQVAGLLEDARGGIIGVRVGANGAGGSSNGSGDELNAESRELTARVVVDATGRARALARRIEQRLKGSDEAHEAKGQEAQVRIASPKRMPLVAFKAHLENVSGAVEGACEIYFYRGGYGGLSRVENGLSNLCFIVAARDVRARGSDAERVMREVLMSNGRAAESLRGARVRSEWLAVALESFGRREPVPAAGLLTVGDAASFIDPFTGSGMLMALEGGELLGAAVARALPDLRAGGSFASLAEDYRTRYRARFAARLRVCALLRRAAFAPQLVTEAGIAALAANDRVRRALARATRHA